MRSEWRTRRRRGALPRPHGDRLGRAMQNRTADLPRFWIGHVSCGAWNRPWATAISPESRNAIGPVQRGGPIRSWAVPR